MSKNKAVFDVRPGAIETMTYDPADNKFYHQVHHEVDGVVQAAKVLADDPPKGDWWRHAAYIPEHVFNEAARDGWLDDPAAWKKWANNPDNAAFRTWKGRL